jgi:hypothetical protein
VHDPFLRLAPAALVLLAAVPAAAQSFEDVPDEPVARTSEHYPQTNERRHDLFFPRVAGRGGAYLGVGSDQSYSIAAATGAEAIFLVDYDPVVTRLHRALGALILRCPDAACLRASLRPDAEEASARAVAEAVGEDWEGRRTVRAFRLHRPLLAARLEELSERDGWLTRPEWYAHLRGLHRRGRVVARTADLTGPTTMRAIGEAARRAGLVFEVLYLSNAEEYFSYGSGFVENLAALPANDSTVVLRTLRDRRLSRAPGDPGWHYDVQPLADLLRRIRDHGYRDSSWIVHDLAAAPTDPALPSGLSVLDERTPVRGEAGPRRWWLHLRGDAPRRPRSRRASRVLRTARRAILPALTGERASRLRTLDLGGTGLARMGTAALPEDPRSGETFVLSGEPFDPEGAPRVEAPEDSLVALLVDGVVRDVLPVALERAGLDEEAERLERAPAAADLYAAHRLRERLLEICPPSRRARGEVGLALGACRHATRLIRPAPNARARLEWPERRRRMSRALASLARRVRRLDPEEGGAALLRLVERLATVARAVRPAAQNAR